jgi:hypothetical protein
VSATAASIASVQPSGPNSVRRRSRAVISASRHGVTMSSPAKSAMAQTTKAVGPPAGPRPPNASMAAAAEAIDAAKVIAA